MVDGPTNVVSAGPTRFTAVAAISTTVPISGGDVPLSSVNVVLSDQPGVCDFALHGRARAGVTMLDAFVIAAVPSFGAAVAPGTYAIGRGVLTTVTLNTVDLACRAGTPVRAATGSMTIQSNSATEVRESLDVTLPDGSRLTGTFTAPMCGQTPAGLVLTCG